MLEAPAYAEKMTAHLLNRGLCTQADLAGQVRSTSLHEIGAVEHHAPGLAGHVQASEQAIQVSINIIEQVLLQQAFTWMA